MMDLQPVTILVVEDDAAHAKLIERNLRRAGISNTIQVIDNGQEALDYLSGRGNYASRGHTTAPLLILLDINMPGINGHEVLEEIKGDAALRVIPVIMLTSSDDPREVQRCYDMGCNAFVTKPVEPSAFSQTVRDLGLFLNIVAAPTPP